MKNFLTKVREKSNQIAIAGSVALMSVLNTVSAHAVDTDLSAVDMTAINTSISGGISNTKTEFMIIIGTVVAGGMAFFTIKYCINNGIGFFSKISKKG